MTHRNLLVLALLITGAIYCLGANGPLVLDDGINLSPLLRLSDPEVPWYSIVLTNISGSFGRPVSMFTFWLNYCLSGFSPLAFKLTNIGLHLLLGVVIYRFIILLLGQNIYREIAPKAALMVAAVWLISPFFTSTVLYAVQRMAILSALFVLLALSSYLQLRASILNNSPKWRHLIRLLVFSAVGAFSKENAVLIPLFLVVIEFYFCDWPEDKKTARLILWLILILGFFPTLAAIGYFVHLGPKVLGYQHRSYTLMERSLTETRVMWSYVQSLLLPRSNQFGLFHDDIALSRNIFSPLTTLFSILGWVATIFCVVILRPNKYLRPILGGIAFFIVGHLLESTVFALEIYFEHRNYLPGIGLYLALVLSVIHLEKSQFVSARNVKIVFGLYLAVFLLALSQRVLIWTRYETIVYSSYASHPNSGRSIIEAASQDAQYGKLGEAIEKLNRVKERGLAPNLGVNIQIVWSYCLVDQPGLERNVQKLVEELRLDDSPYSSTAMMQLNELYLSRPCSKVPYAEFVSGLGKKAIDYYRFGQYRNLENGHIEMLEDLQVRIMEAFNLTGQTQQAVNLANAIENVAGKNSLSVTLLAARALIDLNKLSEAKVLIDRVKVDKSMSAQAEAAHIISLDKMYEEKIGETRSGGAI